MNEVRNRVWLGSLNADMNSRYFGHLRSDYYLYDMVTKIFLAVMSSGTVGAWLIWQDAVKYPNGVLFWKFLSSASAVLAVILPIINFAKKLDASGRLRVGWDSVKNDYDVLWMRIESEASSTATAISSIEKIIKAEAGLAELETILPLGKTKLIRQCQNEIKTARGLI